MKILMGLLVGVLVTMAPFLFMELTAFLQDNNRKRKIARATKTEAMRLMGEPSKVAEFNNIMSQAMHDRRLASKQRPIMVPDKKKIKEMKDAGQPVDEDNPPMKKLQNSAGEDAMEWTAEKCDPRFDQFRDGEERPIFSRIYVDPGKGAPTFTRTYWILLALGIIIGIIAFMAKIWALLAVPFVLGCIALAKMRKRGMECVESDKTLWEKLEVIYTKNIRPLKEGENIHDLVTVTEWSCLNDDVYQSNAKTMASEQGLSGELDKILPKPDPKTGRIPKPRRAVFYNVPAKITINFDANFMRSGTEALLNHLNQSIGGGTVEWVAQKSVLQPDGTYLFMDGWDFDKMKVDLMTLPPLPELANLPEDIDETPWNTIRIGRTVTGEAVWDLSGQGFGLRPKTDAEGNVLRDSEGAPIFPQSLNEPGAQLDTIHHAKKAGVTCPMALVPLDVNTPVWVLEDDDDEHEPENADDPATES